MRKIEEKMITAINYYLSGGDREYIFLGNTVVYSGVYTSPLYVNSTLYNNVDKAVATVTLYNNVIAYITTDYLYFTPYFTSITTKSRLNALIETFTNLPIKFCSENNYVTPVLQNFFTDFYCIPYGKDGKADVKQVTRNHRPAIIIPDNIQWIALPRSNTQGQVILYK